MSLKYQVDGELIGGRKKRGARAIQMSFYFYFEGRLYLYCFFPREGFLSLFIWDRGL